MLRRHPVQSAEARRALLHGLDKAPFAGGAFGGEFDEHVAATAAVHPFEALVAGHYSLCHRRRSCAREIGFEAGRADALARQFDAGGLAIMPKVEGPGVVAVTGQHDQVGL